MARAFAPAPRLTARLSRPMRDWFDSPLGRFVLAQEQQRCGELLPSGYYPNALQVGAPAFDFLAGGGDSARFLLVEDGDAAGTQNGHGGDAKPRHRVIAKASALPFGERAHNLIALPHALEGYDDNGAQAALREAAQVLAPQGCVVVTGFNPFSLWAALRVFGVGIRPGRARRAGQIQDWLAQLGFELAAAGMLIYQPPWLGKKPRRWASWELAGARWWPAFGAVYVIVARKREAASTAREPARPRWQFLPGLAQPAG